MNLCISGRNLTVTDEIRARVSAKIAAALDGKALKFTSVKAVLRSEKNRFCADIVVLCKKHNFAASVQSYDIGEAIDDAAAKISTQLDRLLTRIREHHAMPLREITLPLEPMPVPEA